MKLVSACLLGVKCNWGGKSSTSRRALELSRRETLIPVCPEQLGGLPTPRAPQEIQGGTGDDVLSGNCMVINKNGENVTAPFIRGAQETLRIARRLKIKEFIARDRSPSCGCGHIYNGSFSGRLVPGDGVTTTLLKKNGIKVSTAGSLPS